MEIIGKVIAVLPAKSGTSRNGTAWMSQQYVIETGDRYPRKFTFDVLGEEKIKNFDIKEGDSLKVYFDPDAQEHDGKWYAANRAWKIEKA